MNGVRRVVFVGYSHADAKWLNRLMVMLAPVLKRELEVWSDEQIRVGEEWRAELAHAIGRAGAAVLLVSPDFLASKFIMEEELPALIERDVRLICVLVESCLWKHVPALERVQWAHDPKRPLAQQRDRNGAIVRICEKLLEAVPAIPVAVPEDSENAGGQLVGRDERRVAAVAAAAGMGELLGVPPLPPAFVAREELDGLRTALLGEGEGAVGVTGRGLGLHGQGGIGKTVLAAAVAHDKEIRRHFPDGVFWVTLGEGADMVAAQRELLTRLGAGTEVRIAIEGKAALSSALAERQCLLVIHDVWSAAAASAFRVTGARGRVLYTTRDPTLLKAVAAAVLAVDVLPEQAARKLLASLAGETAETLPAEADAVLLATGRVALAVALVGAAIGRGGTSWSALVEQLKQGARTFLLHPYANAFKALQAATAALDQSAADAYSSLAVYPQDTRVPAEAIVRYWTHLWTWSEEQTRQQLQTLADRALLSLEDETIAFHDLQRDFLLLQVDDLSLQHAELLAAYRHLLPTMDSSWAQLPPEEPYIWEHLIYHLHGAGDGSGMVALVTDLAYLVLRCFRSGAYAAESDLRHTAQLYPDDEAIAWLVRVFTHSGHLFVGCATVADLAAMFWSRIQDAPPEISGSSLKSLLPRLVLEPRWGLRHASSTLIRVLEGHTGAVHDVEYSPDGQTLASAGEDGMVRLWDPATGQGAGTLACADEITVDVLAVAFSPDGRQLAISIRDEWEASVSLWDAATREETALLELAPASVAMHALAFSPDGALLAIAPVDGVLPLWDPRSAERVATREVYAGYVRELAFSPDSRQLAMGSGGTVRLWDVATRRTTATLETDTDTADSVRALAFSPNGDQLATGGDDDAVRLWDLATGEPIRTLEGHTEQVNGVAFSPDGTLVASVSDDRTVRLWDVATGESVRSLIGHTDDVWGVAFSPDGGNLATASRDGTVRLWDPHGRSTDTLTGHTRYVVAVAFSPGGRLLASASTDRTVQLWDSATGQRRATIECGTRNSVRTVAFSPDGRLLATAGPDATVRLWDSATGQRSATLEGHGGSVYGVAFSHEGTVRRRHRQNDLVLGYRYRSTDRDA